MSRRRSYSRRIPSSRRTDVEFGDRSSIDVRTSQGRTTAKSNRSASCSRPTIRRSRSRPIRIDEAIKKITEQIKSLKERTPRRQGQGQQEALSQVAKQLEEIAKQIKKSKLGVGVGDAAKAKKGNHEPDRRSASRRRQDRERRAPRRRPRSRKLRSQVKELTAALARSQAEARRARGQAAHELKVVRSMPTQGNVSQFRDRGTHGSTTSAFTSRTSPSERRSSASRARQTGAKPLQRLRQASKSTATLRRSRPLPTRIGSRRSRRS